MKGYGPVVKQLFENGTAIVHDTGIRQLYNQEVFKFDCAEIDKNSDKVKVNAMLSGLWDGGSQELKGALIFGGIVYGVGAVVDFFVA